ncbi:uncharacterized protein LOC124925313 [Impatiens glandulifera]|uniref:uncharacterized protein LOC124925313 n=1 Tax=Impatiens glandulifera TaxID=253017 RepID=UPI001FB19742|nr:uncharacterized protein LOC124925313 [Impatiens glandulifera]
MSGRGRDRFHRDYPPRAEEKGHHGRNSAPPSRHLWIGNLPHDISENFLAHHLLQFGELESLAFQTGRSYAFVNYKNEEDAFEAIRALQGFLFAGNSLRIEFAKADKSSTTSRSEDYGQYQEEGPSLRAPPFSERDSRHRHSSPDPFYPDKSMKSDKTAESPSQVLWVGFPASLKVDEFILRRAFSPFGEIDQISAFPGRTYAFVRFKSIMAACKAKETLQGKLFGNPRVHISFSKNEIGPSKSGKSSMNPPSPPHSKSFGRGGPSGRFREDRDFRDFTDDDLEPNDHNIRRFHRRGNSWEDLEDDFEHRRFREPGPNLVERNTYIPHGSPRRHRVGESFHEMSPQQFSRNGAPYDDPWDLPKETMPPFRGAKKLKTSPYSIDNELPEYPLSGPDQRQRVYPRTAPDSLQPKASERNFERGPFAYNEMPDRSMNLNELHGGRSEGSFQAASSIVPSNNDRKRPAPDSHQTLAGEWKWEGTIAKGGTSICRARCFPVGKPLDMTLPDFLDCTARTGLEMLAKHYYQAANAWVVFFVPQSDADIGFYNEFMYYLGEKQRVAVAKLDDRTSLFLVPPSDFSEKVLKVPGNVSISGVILKLDTPGSKPPSGVPHHSQSFANPGRFKVDDMSARLDYSKSAPLPSFQDSSRSVQRDFMNHPLNDSFESDWSPHHRQNPPNLDVRNLQSQANDGASGFNNVPNPKSILLETSSNIASAGSGKLPQQESAPAAVNQTDLARLASSLFGQQSLAGGYSAAGDDFRLPNSMSQTNFPSEVSSSQFGQVPQREFQTAPAQGNRQPQSSTSTQDGDDADPQKRLHATLQLAAALLQQIQHGKGT